MSAAHTIEEMEYQLGRSLRALRLLRNIDQETLASRAGIAVRSLKNLESGKGTNLRTMLSVVRALGRSGWLDTIAPVATINPVTMPASNQPRRRASKRKTAAPADHEGDQHVG